MKRTQKMQQNGLRLQGKTIIGIDPAKNKHQAIILGPDGSICGRSFSFETNHTGFTETLPQRIEQRLVTPDETEVVYAIEGSCALWQNLAFHLSEQGQEVVLISPLATYHARPSITGDFSRTDQKDAELVARLAQQGSYREMPGHSDHERALHRMAICYDKLRKSRQRHYARLRSLVERLFPEFLTVLTLDTKTARYLLSEALLPDEFLALEVGRTVLGMQRALNSNPERRRVHGRPHA